MKKLQSIILGIFVFSVSFAVPYYSLFADFSTPTNSYTEEVVASPTIGVEMWQPLGTGITGTTTGATFNFHTTVASGGDLWAQMEIVECNSESDYEDTLAGTIGSGCSTQYGAGGFPANQFTGTGNKTFTWDGTTGTLDTLSFNPAKWYLARLHVIGWTGTSLTASIGGSTDQYFPDSCISGSPSNGDCEAVASLSLSLTGVSLPGFGTYYDARTRIISFDPSAEVVNATTDTSILTADVDWTLDYYFNDTTSFGVYDQVGLEIENIENGIQTLIPYAYDINASGGTHLTGTFEDLDYGQWFVIVYFYNSETGVKEKVKSYVFTNLYTKVPSDLSGFYGANYASSTIGYISDDGTLREDCSSLDGTFDRAICALTNSLKDMISYFFRPSPTSIAQFQTLGETLKTKAPFSYAYDTNNLRQELFSASTTASTTISVSTKFIPGQGTTTITFLSASMLNAVPYSGTVKTVLGWILWLFAIEYIYYRVLRSHDNQTPQ